MNRLGRSVALASILTLALLPGPISAADVSGGHDAATPSEAAVAQLIAAFDEAQEFRLVWARAPNATVGLSRSALAGGQYVYDVRINCVLRCREVLQGFRRFILTARLAGRSCGDQVGGRIELTYANGTRNEIMIGYDWQCLETNGRSYQIDAGLYRYLREHTLRDW